MAHDFTSADLGPEISMNQAEVPQKIENINGQEVLVIGDPTGYAEFNHQQGDNPYGYQNDCGLVSCQDVLNQFGIPVSETDVVSFASQHGLCNTSDADPSQNGGTVPDELARILNDYGVPAHTETSDNLESLATHIEQGNGVIVAVNAGVLWNDANYYDNGQADHAITVTGVVRDPTSGQIEGFYINDSGTGKSAEYVDANTMQQAWEDTGGQCVVTDISHTTYP
jgi:uncharacterized protein YvpB